MIVEVGNTERLLELEAREDQSKSDFSIQQDLYPHILTVAPTPPGLAL